MRSRAKLAHLAFPDLRMVEISFDEQGQLDLSGWHTIRLEIIARRAVEELARRDDLTPGCDLDKLQGALNARL